MTTPTPLPFAEFDHVLCEVQCGLAHDADATDPARFVRAADLAMLLHDAALHALRYQLAEVSHASA